ncbi:hypothetical protein OXYTRIMIC_748 [Oxytricha trifallax]|uniref:Uncharacterized protein n=1 Tax=Oxytricha trifallax TaxID=1172189 RepID=A0A073ICM1_9SPIT|nr:hypothetical protein OXYTRIMIC_748 [Oxytricha trifallax]
MSLFSNSHNNSKNHIVSDSTVTNSSVFSHNNSNKYVYNISGNTGNITINQNIYINSSATTRLQEDEEIKQGNNSTTVQRENQHEQAFISTHSQQSQGDLPYGKSEKNHGDPTQQVTQEDSDSSAANSLVPGNHYSHKGNHGSQNLHTFNVVIETPAFENGLRNLNQLSGKSIPAVYSAKKSKYKCTFHQMPSSIKSLDTIQVKPVRMGLPHGVIRIVLNNLTPNNINISFRDQFNLFLNEDVQNPRMQRHLHNFIRNAIQNCQSAFFSKSLMNLKNNLKPTSQPRYVPENIVTQTVEADVEEEDEVEDEVSLISSASQTKRQNFDCEQIEEEEKQEQEELIYQIDCASFNRSAQSSIAFKKYQSSSDDLRQGGNCDTYQDEADFTPQDDATSSTLDMFGLLGNEFEELTPILQFTNQEDPVTIDSKNKYQKNVKHPKYQFSKLFNCVFQFIKLRHGEKQQ